MRRSSIALILVVAGSVGACAPLAREHQADAAFRAAIAAQLAHEDARAEELYRDILKLGFDWSPVWNNLAVVQVHNKNYVAARNLLAQAVAANDRDVVALTNYGVINYHLGDFAEARHSLEEARRLRIEIIDSIPSQSGRTSWEEDRYARVTAPLDETAKRYLARIDAATLSDAPLPPVDLMADVTVVGEGSGRPRL